jgi:hypothetical protein
MTHLDGRVDEHAPRRVVTATPLQFGDQLPLANVDCWITEVIDGEWTDDEGRIYDALARAAAGPTRDESVNDVR